MGAGPAHEEPRAQQASPGLAAVDRFAVPDLRQGSAPADPVRRAVDRDARQRARRRDQGADRRTQRPRDRREDVPDPRHLHRYAGHRRQLPHPHRAAVPRPRLQGRDRDAPQPRHLVHPVRARVGPHDRPDEPLQHDVRPVLHGRQPGRLRPRADLRRRQEAARRRHRDQAAPADDGAVLGRRADHLAALPGGRRLRPQGRLLQRPGGDQRHPLRPGAGVRQGRRGGRHAHRLPAVRRHRRGRQRPPQGRQPVRRQAARHRAPLPGRHRRVPGRHHRQHGEQRPGRADHPLRDGELRQDQLRLVPAGLVHRPRRTASASRRTKASRRRPPRRGSASPTSSSTASATSTTSTARSATSTTSSCGRSRTSTSTAST